MSLGNLSPQELEQLRYYNENRKLHSDTKLDAEAASFIPGMGVATKAGKAAYNGLGSSLSRYFNNLFGKNVPKIAKEAKTVSKNQKKIKKALSEPTSRYSKRALTNKEKEYSSHALNVAKAMKRAKEAQQTARVGTGVGAGVVASSLASTRDQKPNIFINKDTGSQAVAVPQKRVMADDFPEDIPVIVDDTTYGGAPQWQGTGSKSLRDAAIQNLKAKLPKGNVISSREASPAEMAAARKRDQLEARDNQLMILNPEYEKDEDFGFTY